MSFVLYEKERDTWYNNEGHNFHVPLSLDAYRSCSYDTEYSLEKEISEYLEYAQQIKLRLRDVHDYIELWPEKVTDHLCKLLESHKLEGYELNGQDSVENERQVFVIKNQEAEEAFQKGLQNFLQEVIKIYHEAGQKHFNEADAQNRLDIEDANLQVWDYCK